MKLVRPFEDELVGSALSRALRDFGLNVPTLMKVLTGRSLAMHSFIVSRHPRIADAFGMPVEEFFRSHTMMNYSLAFMPSEKRACIWSSALSAKPNSGWMADVAKNLTNTNPRLRFCPDCVIADLAMYGQTFWRRVHQLPAVHVCLAHGQRLVVTDMRLQARLPVEPPHLCTGVVSSCNLPMPAQLAIAKWSAACLTNTLTVESTWPDWFRQRASALGYQLVQGTKFGTRLSRDLERFYTSAFLQEHKCAVDREVGLQWPARLLRNCSHGIEPLKHVLMCAFLESEPVPTTPEAKVFKLRGPRRDRSQEDIDAVKRMDAAARVLRREGAQINLTVVLRKAGLEAIWRHSYPQLPRMKAWVAAFKATAEYARWPEKVAKRRH